jgi:1,2-diacylglycerol 3-beta-galactosyltransferase
VRERDAGIVVHSFKEVERAVTELLAPGTLGRMRSNAAAIQNRAVFEIPDILEKILASQDSDEPNSAPDQQDVDSQD